ncbi:hypothetical protein KBZ20_01325 [Vulcanococcus limneticus Candia 3F8]|uniref:hypothetical protein n=1 Tax=Vulcanococcus limneticus TaxID=2170428 RepID=UPI0012FF9E61|nr:hypothetical protein [Vulcanococcus limneticus]MCP9790361.1 hypothetical protein [Vulcanococcus limneticus MW73D5]MCP9892418.1 hypothetical protein [Vulcanococcus limneticus Candia 3F8]MCP9895760.1 hypothetical protein [Vulcanococcus limneticus Candia 3B3]
MPSLLYTPVRLGLSRALGLVLGGLAAGAGPLPAVAAVPVIAQSAPARPTGPQAAQSAPAVSPGPSGSATGAGPAASPAEPAGSTISQAAFEALLLRGDLASLDAACLDAARFDLVSRLRMLRNALLAVQPTPRSLELVLRNANALLNCRAPDDALTVLNRYGPQAGSERDQWLIQQWRAANAGLHHRLAAEALERLSQGSLAALETIPLPLQLRQDGSLATRPALDVYAEHLVVLGREADAAAALLAGRLPGRPAAERLQRAAALLRELPLEQRNQLLETALDQAAAAGAWGLAASLLADQRALLQAAGLSDQRPSERFLKLAQRIDDAYGEWQIRRQDPQQGPRSAELQRQLRSPREPGGHARSQP